MANKNTNLHTAKNTKDDEFYTTYETIESEVKHYISHFSGKTVLCNCDDPFESNFCKYFLKNFNTLNLHRLICTSYCASAVVGTQLTLLDDEQRTVHKGAGYVLDIEKFSDTIGVISDEEITHFLQTADAIKKLDGNGDFRSNECIEYLKECDIIVTNPPFSLFKEIVTEIIKNHKKFLIIGNQNAITYKEIFPLIQNNEVWTGYRFGEMKFRVPEYSKPRKYRYWVDESGQKWRSLGNAMWLTNLDNMPNTQIINGDITNVDVKKQIIELSQKLHVNMIIGGPPCQGFSLKGKKLGLNDPRNYLFNEYLNIVEILQPDVFTIENVKALLSTSAGWFKNQIIEKVHKLGYHVSYGILNASTFGVPQARERAIFLCCKEKEIGLPVGNDTIITVKDAIGDLAYLNSGEGVFEQEYLNEPTSDYQRARRKNSHKLYNHKASNHSAIAIQKLSMIPPECGKEHLPQELLGKQQFSGTWGRLKWNSVSPTIDTRFDASSNGTNNHPFLNRAITPREAARLQSFDDDFVFIGAKVQIRQQIGNAVPPLMAKAIADKIYEEIGV